MQLYWKSTLRLVKVWKRCCARQGRSCSQLRRPQQRLERMLDIVGISDAQRVHFSCRVDMRDAEGTYWEAHARALTSVTRRFSFRISHYTGGCPVLYNALSTLVLEYVAASRLFLMPLASVY